MATSRSAWGIDVGNRALKAVRLSREGDGFRIEDFDVIEHETPLSQSGDNRDALITKALTEFVGRHKTGSIPVGISAAGQTFAKFIKLPPVEEKNIPNIVRFEALQQIPFSLDEVEWSYQLFRKQDDPEVEVGIFAMRKEAVNAHVGAYTDVNLNVQVVQMSPMAVYNAMAFDGKLEGDGATLIIDMGADTTDLVVADGDQVWHRKVPLGGNNFTEALVRGFKLDFAKAEAMKREASTSKYARQIFQAMRPVFEELVGEIQRSIGFYASTHRDAQVKRAIALGGTFKLPGLQKYLQQNLQLDVIRPDAFANAAPPADARLAGVYQDNVLSAGAAYGLAVQAMGDAKITSSLLPGHIRRQKVWRDKTKWFAASAALFVAGAGVAVAGAYLPKIAFDGAQEFRDRAGQALTSAQALDSEWSQVEGSGETERNLIKNVYSLKTERDIWPRLTTELRTALPTDPASLSTAAAKATPRPERKHAQIDGWISFFVPDVGALLKDTRRERFAFEVPSVQAGGSPDGGMGGAMPTMLGQAGVMPMQARNTLMSTIAAAMSQRVAGPGDGGMVLAEIPKEVLEASNGKHGFVLRITGVTPNREASRLLDEVYLHKLLETRFGAAGAAPRDFYIADAFVVKQGAVRDNPTRLQAMLKAHTELQRFKQGGTTAAPQGRPAGAEYGGAPEGGGLRGGDPRFDPGMGGGFQPPAPSAPGQQDDPTPYLDPVTNEDTRSDTEFMILAFVVVGPPPVATPTAPAEGTPAPAQPPAP